MSADRLIVRYHATVGAALFSLDTNDFIRDEQGQPIAADARTGKAKGEVELCPTCRRPLQRTGRR